MWDLRTAALDLEVIFLWNQRPPFHILLKNITDSEFILKVLRKEGNLYCIYIKKKKKLDGGITVINWQILLLHLIFTIIKHFKKARLSQDIGIEQFTYSTGNLDQELLKSRSCGNLNKSQVGFWLRWLSSFTLSHTSLLRGVWMEPPGLHSTADWMALRSHSAAQGITDGLYFKMALCSRSLNG